MASWIGRKSGFCVRNLPARSGAWQFKFDTDKLTDEERVQALAHAEGTQAKYELMIVCRSRAPELLISALETVGTEGKKIPWDIDDVGPPNEPSAYKRIRLRIDTNPAFTARLHMHGYRNEGRMDLKEEFENSSHAALGLYLPTYFRTIRLRSQPHFRLNLADYASS